MEAARPLSISPASHRRSAVEDLEQLRPLGEGYILRNFGHSLGRADAEDAVADVIIRLHRKIEDGDLPRNLRATFFTSVRNAAIDQLRSRTAKPTAPLELVEDAPAVSATPSEQVESRDTSVRLQEALDRMRPNYREALRLRFGAGLTVPEIAECKGISLPAAKKLVLRSTAQIRKRLAAIEGEEFCPEMRDLARTQIFDREAAGLATESDQRILQAHFQHCGSCRTFLTALHRDLHDLGSGAAIAAGAGETHGHLALADHLGRWLGHASDATHALAAKARLLAYKAGGAFGPDATSASALTGTAQKVAAVCGAATATTACVATGIIGPGLGGVNASPQPEPNSRAAVPAHVVEAVPEPAPSPQPAEPAPVAESQPEPAPSPEPKPEPGSSAAAQPNPAPSGPVSEPEPTPSQQSSQEFGFESSSPSPAESAPAPEPSPPPTPPASPASSGSGAGGAAGGGSESFGFGG